MNFISYARVDEQFALNLARELRAAGTEIWIDQIDIRPSEIWERAIEQAMESCERMLVVLSPASAQSPNVMAEVNFALDEGKPVIPVLYRECRIPYRLRLFQRADFSKDHQQGMVQLARALNHPIAGSAPDGRMVDGPAAPPTMPVALTAPVERPVQQGEVVHADSCEFEVRRILEQPQWEKKIHVDPAIPADLLSNARKLCPGNGEKILGLLDTTVFGSATEALVFSDQGLHFLSGDKARFLSYRDLKQVAFSFDRAPFFSKYNWMVRFEAYGISQAMGIAGGPLCGETGSKELISLLETLKSM
jgi:TIR domain